jgi:hypothetical protein
LRHVLVEKLHRKAFRRGCDSDSAMKSVLQKTFLVSGAFKVICWSVNNFGRNRKSDGGGTNRFEI